MTGPSSNVFGDPELVELFAREPELLAVADAVAATTPSFGPRTSSRSARGHWISQFMPQRRRWLVFALSVAAVAAAAPAFAFPAVRQLVGFGTTIPLPRAPYVTAKVTGEWFHNPAPYALPTVTITFTVGERGKGPGIGIRRGAYFLVFLNGRSQVEPFTSATARGSHGRYYALVRVPKGGISSIQIGGFMNAYPSPANGGKFWIPVKVEASGNF